MKRKFINENEGLLVWFNCEEHVSTKETMETPDDALPYGDDRVEKFFRFDEKFNFEDVTEDVAAHWLEKYGDRPSQMNVDAIGPWLKYSTALEDYIDGYDSEDRLYEHDERLGCHSQGVGRFGPYGA